MTRTQQGIPRAERLIVALDLPTAAEARALVDRLGDAVRFYKVGLELFSAPGCFELVAWLAGRGHKVFVDLKLHDIPETVRRAVANLRGRGATFLTVHGQRSVMQAAAQEKGDLKILAVTVLTSFDQRDLDEVGSAKTVEELVLARARGALETGCDGVIASGLEAARLKAEFKHRLLVVTPGIRPVQKEQQGKFGHDQKRTVDVAQAFTAGADYIVVGRPIREAPDPRAAAAAIQQTIAKLFPETATGA
jgi:orotidine-5'-phosphate decarboxylase